MDIQINNYSELLEFIKREDINNIDATEIVCKALNVLCPLELSKDILIETTEYYINKFCQDTTVKRPTFLQQRANEFNINHFYL